MYTTQTLRDNQPCADRSWNPSIASCTLRVPCAVTFCHPPSRRSVPLISLKFIMEEAHKRKYRVKMEAKHALVVIFPVQGTFNAVFDFSKVLSARGFMVTFVNTEYMHRRLFESRQDEEEAVKGHRIRFRCLPDGLPHHHDRANMTDVSRGLQRWDPELEKLAATLEGEGTPVTCVVGNFAIYSVARRLARKLGVPSVIFWPLCAAAAVAHCYTRRLVGDGHVPRDGEDALITCLPDGTPPALRYSDIPATRLDAESLEDMLNESDCHLDADCVVVNSFLELEGPDVLRGLSVNCTALMVGPLFLHQETDTGTSMWKEDAGCLGWLNAQPPGSVLYVSFGSIAALSVDQLHELALGLEASQQRFLWSLRAGSKLLDAVLPRGFAERTSDRGLVVGWAPQRHVLAHPSVGGFLTHFGWNSTLESIGEGVPMVGWPVFFDQFVNWRFATEVWKVGITPKRAGDGLVVKDEVERVVRVLMEGEEGKVVRENAKRVGDAARKSVMPGGSSYTNIDTLVRLLDDNDARQNQTK